MTKKEVVAELRKAFNNWVALLPDCEYESCNDHSEVYPPEDGIRYLHTLELGAEATEEEFD